MQSPGLNAHSAALHAALLGPPPLPRKHPAPLVQNPHPLTGVHESHEVLVPQDPASKPGHSVGIQAQVPALWLHVALSGPVAVPVAHMALSVQYPQPRAPVHWPHVEFVEHSVPPIEPPPPELDPPPPPDEEDPRLLPFDAPEELEP